MLFGGAAGSLKSETLLMDASRERENARLRALLLRRSFPELEKSLIRRSREVYPSFGATYNEQKKRWSFPSGGTVEFGYCESEKDIYRYQGAEYSFLGFDESTHFTEFPIRYMLSRLRSTEPSLQLRIRLASNPGNVGHNTHKGIFHGSVCSHCRPAAAHSPRFVYSGAKWPSDQHDIGKTTAFIPGRVSDHALLGADYKESLRSLPGVFRKALLEGCWDVYEGQYFDHWRPETMVLNRPAIGEEQEWPHWVGVDYGFNVSQAAAYLLCRSPASDEFPRGQTFVLDEYTARHQKASDFARAIAARFRREGRRIVAWYLSPDAWNLRGDDNCLADQMRDAVGFEFERASNDRLGGAMLLYTRLDTGELKIANTCPQLIEALASRIHDPDRPDDILKIAGDPLDDCLDAVRYAVYSHIRTPPGDSPKADSADPTIAMLQHRRAEQRMYEEKAPAIFQGRRHRR
jgi:phage terminase large subunit